ncbi:hypothetical protein [Granulicella aggregans]|uniref:hypothetical protein n=1 Tax=Granulicella aggregans TaxID=474949 RepID=UPI0021E07C19|nr:hypothetical protein [Granulicella aggregans]
MSSVISEFRFVANRRFLAVLFLTLSFVTSIALLSVRNLYDDEHISLNYVNSSVLEIIHTANSGDIHPPGMYLLAHFAYEFNHSPRWMGLFPLFLLYIGLAIFVFAVIPLLRTTREIIGFLLIATLHPQLLMWGNTIRWYGWWTGLALLTMTFALQPASSLSKLRFTYTRSMLLGLPLAALFYLNYITLIFFAALSAALLARYTWGIWRQYVLMSAVFVSLIAPQLRAFFTVHTAGSTGQRSGFLISLARLVQATFCSEAYLPWHPLAILAVLAFTYLTFVAVWRRIHLANLLNGATGIRNSQSSLGSITLFALIFFGLVVLSGLGVKPRNGLLALPVLAPLVAILIQTLRPRFIQYVFLGFIGVWSAVGIKHLLLRESLGKASMIDRPEEVVAFISDAHGDECSVIVTYDALLTLTLSNSHLPHLLILTPFQNTVYRNTLPFDSANCHKTVVYLVRSHAAGLGFEADILNSELDAAIESLHIPMRTNKFSFDPDAIRKRKFSFISGAAILPDYRYAVTYAPIPPASLNQTIRMFPHFAVADGTSKPLQGFSSPPEQ